MCSPYSFSQHFNGNIFIFYSKVAKIFAASGVSKETEYFY